MNHSSEGHYAWKECVEYAAKTDIGLRRSNNQDAHAEDLAGSLEAFCSRGHLFIVADGMGAHAAGETASKKAVEAIPLMYRKLKDLPVKDALREAVLEANRQIFECAQANDNFRGMGTTISALVMSPEGAYVAQVGDSRVYRCRGHFIEQLSRDHSLVWELRSLPEEIRPQYIPKNIITRSLGPQMDVEVDVEGPFSIEADDRYVLCTDGLSGQLSDEEIGQIATCLPPEEATQALVDLANLRGGPDNITVTVVHVKSAPQCRLTQGNGQSVIAKKARPPRWLLVAFVVSLLVAVGVAIVGVMSGRAWQEWAAAVVMAILCAGLVLALLVSRKLRRISQSLVAPSKEGAPYATADCSPRRQTLENLLQILAEVEDLARREDWDADWARLEELKRIAVEAQDSELSSGIAAACRAISLLMDVARARRGSRTNHSTGQGFYRKL